MKSPQVAPAAAGPPPAVPTPATVLVVSQRRIEPALAYTSWSEGEDVLLAHTDSELHLLALPGAAMRMRARTLLGRGVRMASSPQVLLPALGGDELAEGERRDVAIVTVKSLWHLSLVEAMRGLRRRVDAIVGWFPEVWPSELGSHVPLLPFALLDEIFVGEPRSVELLSQLLGRPVHFLPLASDVTRFQTVVEGGTLADNRPIDLLNIGRRDPRLHAELLRWADRTGRWYVFDTTRGAVVDDPLHHRLALARQLRRTNVAISSFAKQGQAEVGDLRWVASRVFDNLAAGTLLAGMPPEPSAQRALFGREVVHVLGDDPVAAAARIGELVTGGAPEERAQNVRTSMAGHDWAHRWMSLFETCSLTPDPRLVERVEVLGRAAATLEGTAPQ